MSKRIVVLMFLLLFVAGSALAQADAAGLPPIPGEAGLTEATGNGSSMGLLFFVFVLAIFLGVELISKVPSQLHTPLMSGSNAISGISIVGALLALAVENTHETAMIVLGTLAVALAMINVVGGYLVTDRMLGMFQQKKGK